MLLNDPAVAMPVPALDKFLPSVIPFISSTAQPDKIEIVAEETPKEFAWPTLITPVLAAENDVFPVKELSPETISVPEEDLVKVPVPLMTPE